MPSRVGPRSPRQVLDDPAAELLAHHGAALARDLLALVKDDERGNAADAEACAESLLRLGVDLGQAHARPSPPAAWSKCGAIILQGPHQSAQKSTASGMSDSAAWRWKRASVSARGWA